jgi:hypothetical protein
MRELIKTGPVHSPVLIFYFSQLTRTIGLLDQRRILTNAAARLENHFFQST